MLKALVKKSLSLQPHLSVRNALLAGVQAALTALIVLPLIQLSPYAGLIGFAALGALVALFGRFAPRAERGRILLAAAFWQTFAVFSMSVASWLELPMSWQIFVLALFCGLIFYVSLSGKFSPPGAVIFIFSASVAMGEAISFEDVLARTFVTAGVSLFAYLVCRLTRVFRLDGASLNLPTAEHLSSQQRGYAALRVMFASGLAAYISSAFGGVHPGWAAMGAVAVMQGETLQNSLQRALQRAFGTVLGALLVCWLLQLEPSVWVLIGLIVMLKILVELIIGMNYGLGQVLVTPMALLMTYLASPQSDTLTLVTERVSATVLGAILGVLFMFFFSRRSDTGTG